jgi:hypothetical protein
MRPLRCDSIGERLTPPRISQFAKLPRRPSLKGGGFFISQSF